MSGIMEPNAFYNTGPESRGYLNNNPNATDAEDNLAAYTRMYDIINRANWLIEKVESLAEENFPTPGRKSGIIGEAKALRATANFYLLRLWGQFYDTNSPYGIALRDMPARSAEVFPRSTVSETYDAIIADLDDAIASAPGTIEKFYTSSTYARGLKAKALLYMGDYPAAATLAQDVIANSSGDYALSPTYGEIFLDHSTPALFNASEVVFGSRGTPDEGLGIGNFTGFYATVRPSYLTFGEGSLDVGGQNITHDGDRITTTVFSGPIGLDTYKYATDDVGSDYEMIYHLRMAEVYLIYAEAAARAAGSVTTEALNALNEVRLRAGATTTGGDGFETYPASIGYDQFLEAVRIEKYVELGIESGEEWFDLVRYHFVDGFDVTTVKPTATDPDKFILPIAQVTIDAGGGVVEQNPTY